MGAWEGEETYGSRPTVAGGEPKHRISIRGIKAARLRYNPTFTEPGPPAQPLQVVRATRRSIDPQALVSPRKLAMLDLALEEKLDELDPLRHLRDDPDLDSGDSATSDSIVPAQPPSILDQTIELTFPCPTNEVSHEGDTNVAIRLAVDASPGCGGIAWPAGEVRGRRFAGTADT